MIDVFLSILGGRCVLWGPRGHKVTHIGSGLNSGVPSEAQRNLTGGSPVVVCG
jgi:hypothetical protein